MTAPQIAGMIQPGEGARLLALANIVPYRQAIVEIGSHTGLSTAWMAHAHHVVAVDPWGDPRPGSRDDPLGLGAGDNVLATFLANLDQENVSGHVTALRGKSADVARMWVQPIGLLFIDAVHEYAAVLEDYLAWSAFIVSGGWLVFHDYYDDPAYTVEGDTARVIADHVLPSGLWEPQPIVENLWTARRS